MDPMAYNSSSEAAALPDHTPPCLAPKVQLNLGHPEHGVLWFCRVPNFSRTGHRRHVTRIDPAASEVLSAHRTMARSRAACQTNINTHWQLGGTGALDVCWLAEACMSQPQPHLQCRTGNPRHVAGSSSPVVCCALCSWRLRRPRALPIEQLQ
jgi:hypothetical protein